MLNPLVISVSSHDHPGLERLKRSLDRHGWQHEHLRWPWMGFRTKLIGVKTYAPIAKERGFTHIIHLDAYDSMALGHFDDMVSALARINFDGGKVLLSCERACWPDADREKFYPVEAKSPWKHINSGHYLIDIDYIPIMFDGCEGCDDDQRFLTTLFLDSIKAGDGLVRRDDGCDVFQSLAHQHVWHDAFEIRGEELWNHVTGTKIIFAHANGGGSSSNYHSWLPGFDK